MKDRMSNNGLSKFVEELGEGGQVAGKMLQFPELMFDRTTSHVDGDGNLPERLEDEIADILACCEFVSQKLRLNIERIEGRQRTKLNQYQYWDQGNERP